MVSGERGSGKWSDKYPNLIRHCRFSRQQMGHFSVKFSDKALVNGSEIQRASMDFELSGRLRQPTRISK
ncbi:hypothetical protein RRG08_040464 [Elysia crispata]|uniref:Uncharacterized protein n=1 Tax=Elysia crispata TaxID=231223 RepID=A0AAE0ZD12_9GAST|nr:hypothetical protein RRG08_040464 [Elysia crispata]